MNLIDYLKAGQSTQQALADKLGVSQSLICQWLNWANGKSKNASRITAERAKEIEAATSGAVSRYELRPDIYGPAPERAA